MPSATDELRVSLSPRNFALIKHLASVHQMEFNRAFITVLDLSIEEMALLSDSTIASKLKR